MPTLDEQVMAATGSPQGAAAVDQAKVSATIQLLMQSGMSQQDAEMHVANLAASGDLDQRFAELQEQMGRAYGHQDTPGAQGRVAGRVYQAANPLEHLSVALRRRKGDRMEKEVKKGREQARQDLKDAGASAAELRSADAAAARRERTTEREQNQQNFDRLTSAYERSRGPQLPAGGAPGASPGANTTAALRQPPQMQPTVTAQFQGPNPQQGPPAPVGAQVPQQGPPEPGWFDQTQGRRDMRDRFNALRNFEGFAKPRSQWEQSPPGMGDRPAPSGPYPWPRRW